MPARPGLDPSGSFSGSSNTGWPMNPCRLVHSLVLLGCWVSLALGDGPLPPAVIAHTASGPIQLDGRLDEPAWQGAGVIADLIQQSPRPGQPTPYKTTVRVLVVGDSLYFGFECTDPQPARIAIHSMQRDGDFKGDDAIAVVLDTYGDKRT